LIPSLDFPCFAVEYSPFYGIEKGLVLQETRVFNEPHVDPRKCQQVITKLLYLLTQGETFTKVRIQKISSGYDHTLQTA
jgi:coatomer protein complex subunit gamma